MSFLTIRAWFTPVRYQATEIQKFLGSSGSGFGEVSVVRKVEKMSWWSHSVLYFYSESFSEPNIA